MIDTHTLFARVVDDDLDLIVRRDAAIELNDMLIGGCPPPDGVSIDTCRAMIQTVFRLVMPKVLDERPPSAKKGKK